MNAGGSNQKLLREVVIANSKAKTWKDAKQEWELKYIFYEEANCVCGIDIMENCCISNRYTNVELIVGNKCIDHFQREDLSVPNAARACLKRLIKDPLNVKMNKQLLEVAVRCNVLTQSESDRYRKITTGSGSTTRFDRRHIEFDRALFMERKAQNSKVLGRFSAAKMPEMSESSESDESSESYPLASSPDIQQRMEWEAREEHDYFISFMLDLEDEIEREQKKQRIIH